MGEKMDSFLGSKKLGLVLEDLAPIGCMDVGARGGPPKDLLPLAAAVSIFGFEPDETECQRLNGKYSVSPAPFRSIHFFPVALSEKGGVRDLHLTRHRGASSLLTPIPEVGRQFSRSQYTTVEKKVPVETVPLGEFVEKEGLRHICFLKIDVEGLELEILRSARKLLETDLLAVRTEVAFLPIRVGQPHFCDIANFLQPFHFIPMGFGELHHWRRFSSNRHLKWTADAIPFSRGQIAHGDMIFFRDPDALPGVTEAGVKTSMKAAFLAMAFGFVDHAAHIFARPDIQGFFEKRYGVHVEEELRIVSTTLARMYGARGLFSRLGRRRRNFS